MDLATMLSQGMTAEALVRTAAAATEADWQESLTVYGDPGVTETERCRAFGKLLAIAPYRALFTSAVEIWDREQPASTAVIHIGDRA